jgi:hypothetical protein
MKTFLCLRMRTILGLLAMLAGCSAGPTPTVVSRASNPMPGVIDPNSMDAGAQAVGDPCNPMQSDSCGTGPVCAVDTNSPGVPCGDGAICASSGKCDVP